jgi:molybdate transport system permease protein
VLSVIIGTATAWLLHQLGGWWHRVLGAIALLPLVLPPTVLGFFLLTLLGRRSWIGQVWESLTGSPLVFTLNAAIIAATVSTVPIVIRGVGGALHATDPDLLDSAATEGAGPFQRFLWVQLPLIRPALAAAAAISFARAAGDFGATLMVAGNIPGRTQTAALAIYNYTNLGDGTAALRLALALGGLSLAILLAVSAWEREAR